MMFRCSMEPMPDQLVNENAIDARVGPQMKITSSTRGTPTMRVRMSLSWRVRRL